MKRHLKIDVINRQCRLAISAAGIRKLATQVFKREAKNKLAGQVNICFVDDRCIKELNQRFLGKPVTTDVLAFENNMSACDIQADIIVSTQTAVNNSVTFKTTPLYEMRLYVVHGILHILGFNDNNQRAKHLMRKTERKYVH
ncbi:MAG: rRNA maturation RNase YbeY [Candidatus Omnitrophota bacterium]|jgi:probable rRNA maturation factor